MNSICVIFVAKSLKSYSSVATKGNDLSVQKLQDFVQKVDEAQRLFREQGLNYSITSICKMVAAMPAPRFYIYPEKALSQYSLYRNGKSDIRSDSRRRMYAEIFARYENMVRIAIETGQRVCKKDIMRRVLEQEAPCFYYDGCASWRMYYRFLKRKRKGRV